MFIVIAPDGGAYGPFPEPPTFEKALSLIRATNEARGTAAPDPGFLTAYETTPDLPGPRQLPGILLRPTR